METIEKNGHGIYFIFSLHFTTFEIFNVNFLFPSQISNTAASKLDQSQKILHNCKIYWQ